jgi:hypothetical protein
MIPTHRLVKAVQNYTLTFTILKKKNHRHLKNIMIYKAKQFYDDKKNFQEKSTYGARWCKWYVSR